jgi:hypothetical protein
VQYIFYSVLFALLYVFLGLGLTLLVLPERLRKYALVLSPLVGFCYLTLAGSMCYGLDLKGTDSYAPFILAPPAALLFYSLAVRRYGWQWIRFTDSDLSVPLVIGSVSFLVISIPMITGPTGVTAMSLTNNDIVLYATVSRYLKEFARTEQIDFLVRAGPGYLFKFVFGAPLSTAVPSSLFSIEPYKLQNVAVHVFFCLSIPVVHSTAREVFRYGRLAAAGVTLLYGLSPLTYYTAYQGFQPQIIATALTVCLLFVHCTALELKASGLRAFRGYLAVAALLTWGILVTYAHMLPLVYLILLCCWIPFAISPESRRSALRWGVLLAAGALVSCVISPSRAVALIEFMMYRASGQAGWHVPLLSPGSVLGFTLDQPDLRLQTGLLGVSVLIFCVFLIAFGLMDAFRKDLRLFALAILILAALAAGYLALAYPGEPEDAWGGYKSYKLISFFLPLFLLSSLVALRNLEFRRTQIRVLPMLALLVLTAGNGISSYHVVKWMSNSPKVLSDDVADLQRLEANDVIESINIMESNWWDTMWRAYFLMRKKLFFQIDTHWGATPLDGQWNLKVGKESRSDILRIGGFDSVETISVNPTYILEKADSPRTLQARIGTGWHEQESTHRWTGAESNRSSILLHSALDRLPVELAATYWPLDPNNRLFVYLNGALVSRCPDNKSCRIGVMVLSKGENVLEFGSSLPPSFPGSGDQRRLGYAFKSIEIRPASESAN